MQEIFPDRVGNPINKRVRQSELMRFASLEGNKKKTDRLHAIRTLVVVFFFFFFFFFVLFHQIQFYTLSTLSRDINTFYDVVSSALVLRFDNPLKEIFPGSSENYFHLGIVSPVSRRSLRYVIHVS